MTPTNLDPEKLAELLEAAGLNEDVDIHVDVYPPKDGETHGAILIRAAESDLAK